MSTLPPRDDRHMADDLDRAWSDAVALTDGGARPAPSVRAKVLAAAAEVAAQQARAAAIAPVAAPVGPVQGAKPGAANLPSWRMRAGSGLLAALIVGVVGWRGVHRLEVGSTVAATSSAQVVALAPTAPLAAAPAPAADVAPPAAVERDAAAAPGMARKAAPASRERTPAERPVVVADARQAERMAPAGAEATLRPEPSAEQARSLAQVAAPPPAKPALPPPVTLALAAPPPPAAVLLPAPAAPAMTVPPPAPAPAQFAIAGAPAPALAATGNAAPARALAMAPQAASQPGVLGAGLPAADAAADRALPDLRMSFALAKRAASAVGAAVVPPSLQSLADRGDVEGLRRLLAAGVPVDEPDAAGRTALLHAVLARQPGAVRALLGAGADPTHADATGLTPRSAAQAGPDAEIAQLLAAH